MGHLRERGRATCTLRWTGLGLALATATAVAACGDDEGSGGGGTTSSQTGPTTTGAGGTDPTGGGGGGGGGTGGGAGYQCDTTAVGATRGSAIALSPDDRALVTTNRDVGSVSVLHVDYSDGLPAMQKVVELDLGAGSEPWQAAVDGCGERAYVGLRND